MEKVLGHGKLKYLRTTCSLRVNLVFLSSFYQYPVAQSRTAKSWETFHWNHRVSLQAAAVRLIEARERQKNIASGSRAVADTVQTDVDDEDMVDQLDKGQMDVDHAI